MPRSHDQDMAIGAVYARSMLSLAQARGVADEIMDEFDAIRDVFAAIPESALLLSPLADGPTRARSLEKMFRGRVSDLMVDSLQVINSKGRLGQLRAIRNAYRRALDELEGLLDVHVTTAVPLSDELRQRLIDVTARRTGKTPRLTEKVDPRLLGGMVVRVGDVAFDRSSARSLKVLHDRLLDRAVEESHSAAAVEEPAE